jgi:hypothetical protein
MVSCVAASSTSSIFDTAAGCDQRKVVRPGWSAGRSWRRSDACRAAVRVSDAPAGFVEVDAR